MEKGLATSLYRTLLVAVVLLQSCNFEASRTRVELPEIGQASEFMNHGQWTAAIELLRSVLADKPEHMVAQMRLGQAYLGNREPKSALAIFEGLMADKGNNLPGEIFFWAGRACHQLDRFGEAENYYKAYVTKEENPDLAPVAYFIKQIGAARQAGNAESRYLIENTGHEVNSPLDEFRPVYSPNVEQRFYYSIHDPHTSAVSHISSLEKMSLKSAEIIRGVWTSTTALDPDLVGDKDLRLLDVSRDGQRVFFTIPGPAGDRKTYQKMYDSDPERPAQIVWNHPVFRSELGDRDLFAIHDSAFLFSSDRLEGYGGYDIYVTFQRMGEWLIQNLGPVVNSKYDEISPFLSNDGRTLYFSSNSDKSIGGYDVFFTTFEDDMETWAPPQNMLPPLNSGLNDLDFRLSENGREALFSSDRPGGYGGLDIYQVYFDKQKTAQIQIRQPQYFFQVRAYRAFSSQEHHFASTDKPVHELPIIFFGERPIVVTGQVKQKLDKVLEFAKLYPHTGLILQAFSDYPAEDPFTLYRPVLLISKVTDYLKAGGMDFSRIQIRLNGNQYPLSSVMVESNNTDLRNTPVHNRIEFNFTNTENLPVQFSVPLSSVMEDSTGMSPYLLWKRKTQDLHFRIMLKETDQLMKATDFSRIGDLLLSVSGDGKRMTYYGGILENMSESRQALRKYQALGFVQAEVVAFIGASRIADDRITSTMIQKYPELKEYIIYQK